MHKGEEKLQKIHQGLEEIQSEVNRLGKELVNDLNVVDYLEEQYSNVDNDARWAAEEQKTGLVEMLKELEKEISNMKHTVSFLLNSEVPEYDYDEDDIKTIGERMKEISKKWEKKQ